MHRPAIFAIALASSAAPAAAQQLRGFGSSTAVTVGEPWVLPKGVTVLEPLVSQNMFDSENCKNADEKEQRNPPAGETGLVTLCLPIRYERDPFSDPIPHTVTIPQGLTFIPEDRLKYQSGFNVRKITVIIKPGQTILLPISVTCINPNRKSNTNLPGVFYKIGPIVKNKQMEEVFQMTAKYEIPFYDSALGNAISTIGRGNKSQIATAMDILRAHMETWPLAKP